MYRAVIVVKRLVLDLVAGFLRHKLVWASPDRLLQKPVPAYFLIVFIWNDPAGAADIAGAHDDRKIEKRLLESEFYRTVVYDIDRVRLLVQYGGRRAVVILETPFDVLGSDRGPVMEFCAAAKAKHRA